MGDVSIAISDKARREKMMSLVERMLEFHKKGDGHFGSDRHLGRMLQEQEMVKREIEATDRAIDYLVPHSGTMYELSRKGMIYRLMEDEIWRVYKWI